MAIWAPRFINAMCLANDDVFAPPPVNLESEAAHGALVRQAVDKGLLAAAHDISDGGLAVALAEMCIGHNIGAEISAEGDIGFWFGEDQSTLCASRHRR